MSIEAVLACVQELLDKKPAGAVVTADVCLVALKSPAFAAKVAGADLDSMKGSIETFLTEKQSQIAPAAAAASSPSAKKDDDDSDDSDDGSFEEEEESEESEEDEEEDEESEDDEEPASKIARVELGNSTDENSKRASEMVNCLRKLRIKVRALNTPTETIEAYITDYLVPLYQQHGFDPNRYTAHDVSRYRLLKEAEALERDGANTNLERSQRRGRATFSNEAPQAASAPKPAFMDEE